MILEGKHLDRKACNKKIAWDALLPEVIVTYWRNWEDKLPNIVPFLCSFTRYQEPIDEVNSHAFGDVRGVSAAIYAVVN